MTPEQQLKEIREEIFDTLVENCPHVDSCPKKCLSSERITCYGGIADSLLRDVLGDLCIAGKGRQDGKFFYIKDLLKPTCQVQEN